MNPVGAMKSMMGMVGSNIVNSAKDATKHVVSKIRQKTSRRSTKRNKKREKDLTNFNDRNENLENNNSSENDELKKFPTKSDIEKGNDGFESDGSQISSDNDSILDFRDRVVTEQEFKRLTELLGRDIKMTNRGNSDIERQIWLTPRRFRTTIRSVQIENLTRHHQKNVFLEFSFGGTLTEVRLLNTNNNQEVPRLIGYPACREFYTHTVDIKPFFLGDNDDLLIDISRNDEYIELKNNNSVDISIDETFEWRGSYLHLERELFRIIAWRANSNTVNDMLGYNEDILKNYATGSVNQMITLSKRTHNNNSTPVFRISLQIVFQEIYDFQLNLCQFTLRSTNEKKDHLNNSESNNTEFGESDEKNDNKDSSLSLDKDTINIDLRDFEKEELLNNMLSCRLNIKFPSFGMDNPFSTKCVSEWLNYDDKQYKLLRWNNIGIIPFRGTIHELERNNLQATIEINYDKKINKIFNSRKQFHCTFNLRNIVYYPYIQTEIKLPDGETFSLEGKIEFGNTPKYHQLGNILEIDDENKLYLIVKIIRIDHLISNIYEVNNILQESDNDDSMDVYVQLSFDSNRKETPVVSGTLHPLFQTELTFILDNISSDKNFRELDENKLLRLLESKGPIIIDVWRKNKSTMAQHLGWTEIHWKDILIKDYNSYNEIQNIDIIGGLSPTKVGQDRNLNKNSFENLYLRRLEYRKFYDRNIGKEIVYETRVFQNGVLLYNLGQRPGNINANSNNNNNNSSLFVNPRIHLEIWTKPDITTLYNISNNNDNKEISKYLINKLNQIVEWSGIGPSLKQSRIRPNIYYWEYVTKSFETWGRQYSYYAVDSRGIRHLLPTFLQPLKPLIGIDNSAKIHHFVHSFPYIPNNNDRIWRTPDLFLLSRQGTPFDHTLLQVCLLIGLNRVAFLACGTLLNRDAYSWAITFHYEFVNIDDDEIPLSNRDHNISNGNNISNINMRSMSPIFRSVNKKKNYTANRSKMKSLSPKSIGNDYKDKFSNRRNNSRSSEAISLSPIKRKNKFEKSLTNNKSIKFYALFWDTIKHVVYRVNNIIEDSKQEEFLKWIKDEGYDLSQLNELAIESYYSQNYQDKLYRNTNYKPNFCLKVVNKLPYRTIDLLVNNKNIFANIQEIHDPMKVSYNLNDSNLWFPFFQKKSDDFINSRFSKDINESEKNKSFINQLPITQNNSYILPCFSWPIINVATQNNYNSESNQNKNRKSKKVQSPSIFNFKSKDKKKTIEMSKNQKKYHRNEDKRDEYQRLIKKKDEINISDYNDDEFSNNLVNKINMQNKFMTNIDSEIDMYCRSINDEIMRYVQVQRFQKSRTIGTRWNSENDNMTFLRMGLKLLAKWEMSDPYTRDYINNRNEFLKWRESFLTTVPNKYRMKYAILTFPCNVPKWIAQQVWLKCNFLSNETDRRSIFSLSVDIDSWPNNIQTIRILILVIHPLKSVQLRKLKLIQQLNSKVSNYSDDEKRKKDDGQKENMEKIGTSQILNELIPSFPKELRFEKDDKLVSNENKQVESKRSSSIIFSEEEPELKLLQP